MVKIYCRFTSWAIPISIWIIFSSLTSAHILVEGRLTGAEGKPMPLARVYLTYPSDNNPIKFVNTNKNGWYRIEIDSEGLWMLHFTGVFHHDYSVALYLNNKETIKLNVKLRAYNYFPKFNRVAVIGNFNNWSVPRAVPLKKELNGTYSAVIESKTDSVIYRLINIRTGGEVEGTNLDGFPAKGITGFNSFQFAHDGKAKIIFNPHKLTVSKKKTSFNFLRADKFEKDFADAYATLENTRDIYKSNLYAHVEEHRWGYKFNFTPYINGIAVMLSSEHNRLVRQALQLSYFELKFMSTAGHYVDVRTSRNTLKIIPPGSVVWSLNPGEMSEAISLAAFAEPLKKKYVMEVVNTNPIARTKEILLREEIDREFHSLNYNSILPYLSILLDQYGDSPEAKLEGRIYSKYIRLKVGDPAPKFSVKLLSDTSMHFTNNSFKDKFYLLEFWSASNKASVDEIVNLQKPNDKFKDKLTVLSVCLNTSRQQADKLLSSIDDITILKAIDEKGFDSPLCRSFEVYSVPKAVLIDPKGSVAAEGWELHGENLEKTLERLFKR